MTSITTIFIRARRGLATVALSAALGAAAANAAESASAANPQRLKSRVKPVILTSPFIGRVLPS